MPFCEMTSQRTSYRVFKFPFLDHIHFIVGHNTIYSAHVILYLQQLAHLKNIVYSLSVRSMYVYNLYNNVTFNTGLNFFSDDLC
jgi:hypothetical protein